MFFSIYFVSNFHVSEISLPPQVKQHGMLFPLMIILAMCYEQLIHIVDEDIPRGHIEFLLSSNFSIRFRKCFQFPLCYFCDQFEVDFAIDFFVGALESFI